MIEGAIVSVGGSAEYGEHGFGEDFEEFFIADDTGENLWVVT